MKFQFGAGLWPVVQRELRETARRPLNHWLRLAGAVSGVVMFCYVTLQTPITIVGTELFANIHLLLLALICAVVPGLTADCIARERREGTLGLLFMTPLTASGIVVGKVLAQVLRAVTLWLAVVPLLAIPFLYGGVTWADVTALLTIELCFAMLCLAAGVLASCLTENRAIAFILAYLATAAFAGESREYQNWRMPARRGPVWASFGGVPAPLAPPFMRSPPNLYFPTPPPGIVFNGPSNAAVQVWTSASTMPPRRAFRGRMATFSFMAPAPVGFAARHPPARVLAEDFCMAALVLLAAVRFAGWCVERSWQDKTPSLRRQGLEKRYCTPLLKDWFSRAMRRSLEKNPIAWLQQYSWKARASKWGLCLLFVTLECFVIDAQDLGAFERVLITLVLVLACAYTYAGVNGFLQDKKSGALELILVSPISTDQIILGRVWGLWKQFLPSVVLLVGSHMAFQTAVHGMYVNGYWGRGRDMFWVMELEIVAIYLTLPVVATCLALTSRNLLVASALTVAIVFGPAILLLPNSFLLAGLMPLHWHGWLEFGLHFVLFLFAFPMTTFAVHAFSALMAFKYLRRSLGRRGYAYRR